MPNSTPLGDLIVPDLTNRRGTSLEIHAHLRQLIIDNTIPPGKTLKQAELARIFGTSRTPMREAFRMLQEEGLIQASPNQRAVVSGLNGEELDQLYSARIALEALGTRITTGRLERNEINEAHKCLSGMRRALKSNNMTTWTRLHRRFHEICMARAGDPLLRVVNSYAERSERYVELYWSTHPGAHQLAEREHDGILEAVEGTNSSLASSRISHHLAHTALTVLQEVSAATPGLAIREALKMATGTETMLDT